MKIASVIKTSTAIITVILFVLAFSSGLFWYYRETQKIVAGYSKIANSQTITQTSNANTNINTNTKSNDNNVCPDFQSRFGSTPEELVMFINEEKDAAPVLFGFQNILLDIQPIPTQSEIKIILKLNGSGKIDSYSCKANEIKSFKSSSSGLENVEISIPEADFAQLVRLRESIETSPTLSYLQNMTSNPTSVKNTLLQRIQQL